jgi:hypothetical protein
MSADSNVNFYEFDGCYSKPVATTFDASLNEQFYNSQVLTVAQCQAEAMRKNAPFFLMNDISFTGTTSTNNNSNCYVPKSASSNLGSIVSETAMTQLFSSLFGSTAKISVNDTCNNMLFRRTPLSPPTSQKCFKYTLDEQVYAPKNKYAYYIKPILSDANLRLATSIQTRPTSYYNDPAKLTQLASYKELLYINESNLQSSGPIYNTFKKFVCDPTQENERLFDIQLISLKAKYNDLISHLDNITIDLSNINYLKTSDNNTIRALNTKIASKKQDLTNLLGSGGANNGRLSDNVFLTQFKIIENSILLLIIIIACFMYYKTRNIKSIISTTNTFANVNFANANANIAK